MATMLDCVQELNLPLPPHLGVRDYNINCPNCDTKKNGKHLNINLEKNCFNCPKCNTGGGPSKFIQLFNNCNEREASDLLSSMGKSSVPRKKEDYVKMATALSVEERDRTYTELLNRLSLSEDHRNNLHNRGLSDRDIERLGYKSFTADLNYDSLAMNLLYDNFKVKGIAGFYQKKDKTWTISGANGIIVPYRNEKGLIQGAQIRLDDCKKRKYRWLSSNNMLNGCRAEAQTHLAGKPSKVILLTEGGMKADIVNALTGQTVLAVSGVSCLSTLEKELKILRDDHGLIKIKTAFDMDYFVNPNVSKAYKKLCELLERMEFNYSTLIWDYEQKGIDDYYAERQKKKSK